MKKFLSAIMLIIASTLCLFGCVDGKAAKYEPRDSVFTSFTAEDFDGNIVDETIFASSKITMINVWGTFCEPCKTEAPELAELNSEYADKGFTVIGIPVDRSRETAADAKDVIAELGADYRHLKVSESIKLFVSSAAHLPYTIFVNKDGYQIGTPYSGAKSKSEWKEIIDEMLVYASK